MDWILLVAMAALLGFMFWSSRRRAARMKEEQEAKARQMLPGAKVLLQGGLYGILVSYDPDDLSKAAEVELAPGAVVEVHSQAILRVVEPETDESSADELDAEDDLVAAEDDHAAVEADVAEGDDAPKA